MMDFQSSGTPTYTGKLVSPSSALQVTAVWACVSAGSDDIATAPLLTYYKRDDGVYPANQHYLWGLLQYEANPQMTSFRFKRLMQTWVMLFGNAYAEIETSGRGQVTALWPWRPDRVQIRRTAQMPNAPLIYRYKFQNGTYTNWLPQENMFHLRGLGLDGDIGLSPIELHKQTIGASMAMTEHGGRFFSNDATPNGVIQYPGKLADKARQNLSEGWKMEHEGLSNAHRIAILEEGAQWKETGAKMVDAQYLQLMQFSVDDIARMYKMPPHRIASLLGATNNNVENAGKEYVDYTFGPWGANWEAEVEFSLLSVRDRDNVCVRFDSLALTMGDMAAQAAFYGSMVTNGIMTQNEVRARMRFNPLPGKLANEPWKQSAMMPAADYTPQGQPGPNQPGAPTPPDPGPTALAAVKPNGKLKEPTQ